MSGPRWWVRPEPEDIEPVAVTPEPRCDHCSHLWHGLPCIRYDGGVPCRCESAWEATA